MQISTLRISDGLLLSWRKKHPLCWVSPKHCIFLPSSVNKTGERTGKARSQHFPTLLNLWPERLRFGEQHNPNKNPPCITPERQDHDSSVDPQSYQEVEAQPGRKHPHHAKAKLLPRTAAAGEEEDVGETEGNMMHEALSSDSLKDTWEDLVWMEIPTWLEASVYLWPSLVGDSPPIPW